MTIKEIKEIVPGENSWINGDLACTIHVTGCTEGKYGPFNWGTIEDETGSMPFNGGGSDLSGLNRKRVIISGKGNKAKYATEKTENGEYVQTKEVCFGIGKNGTVEIDENAPTGSVNAPVSHSGAIHGATVGMSINNASADFRALMATDKTVANWTPKEFHSYIWDRASCYLRISQAMEQGNLAPKPGTDSEEPF